MKILDSNGVIFLWEKIKEYVSSSSVSHADNATNANNATVADKANSVEWENVEATPTTLAGYGIEDACSQSTFDTAINSKADIASPTFTGSVTSPKFITSSGLEIY